MKLKLNAEGFAEVKDGKPVYVTDAGEEIAFDAVGTKATISRLNGEARQNRERYEAAEAGLAKFEGLDDPEAARKAIATVANLDAKKLIDAGEAERVRAEAIKAVDAKYAPIVKKAEALEGQLHAEIVGGAFARSAFLKDKTVLPPHIAQKAFGHHFTIKDGKLTPVDAAGNVVLSSARPGEMADFDEALAVFVNADPGAASILRGTGASGSGAQGGGGAGGAKTMTRAAFEALQPVDQMAAGREAAAGKITITD